MRSNRLRWNQCFNLMKKLRVKRVVISVRALRTEWGFVEHGGRIWFQLGFWFYLSVMRVVNGMD